MTYLQDKTWLQESSDATAISQALRDAIIHGKEAFEAFTLFRNGRTDAQIATALSALQATPVSTQQITDLASCYQMGLEIWNFCNNVAGPTQADRMLALRRFA